MDESPHYPLQFYATAPYSCGYLPDRMARSQVASPAELINSRTYATLMERGFRRSGLFTYRPHCDACQACQTLRIPAAAFVPDRSQRRTWRKYQHLCVRMLHPAMRDEHYALYQRYLKARHRNEGMDSDSPGDYEQFLLKSRVDTRLLEFREADASRQDAAQGALRMVSVVDLMEDSISAVYTFYDPQAPGGLGTYSILWLVEWARRLGLECVYLGYWIAGSPKMAYKARFLPHDVLEYGRWRRVEKAPHTNQAGCNSGAYSAAPAADRTRIKNTLS